MGIRFTVGTGKRKVCFERAAIGTAAFVEQRKGFRLTLGMKPF